jgi:leucyl-tRNA synthetase
MSKYEPRKIELKWQAKWEQEQVYRCPNPGEAHFDPQKKSYYVLDMFPYPSGSGLHVGHASGYIGTDVVARKKRMDGCNVLHPMGWDAFGLPAEQYAIQTNQHPRKTTDINTAHFRKQLKQIGLSYDWSREVDTSNVSYYKWTQWVFLQLYNKGLVYRKEMPVWWCEELKTVLANEEVINGRSERGNFPCVRKPLTQWVFKITEYADKLLDGLKDLDWPESVKKMQEDWIGKSIGAEIDFPISEGSTDKITVFSTRPDTLFGVVAVVLAPEHPLVKQLTPSSHSAEVGKFVQEITTRSERDRKSEADDFSALFTGAYCLHPLTGEKVPVYIASYVLADYGSGAVMAVPSHDERDFLLAKKTGLSLKAVVRSLNKLEEQNSACYTADGVLQDSHEFSGMGSEAARAAITQKLEKVGHGRERISYKIRDWIFSRQRYWGEPFPLLIDEKGNIVTVDEKNLPVELPHMDDFKPSLDGSSPLARNKNWVEVHDQKTGKVYQRVTDTMPGWAGSCWYYLRFMDPHNTKEAFSKDAINYWKHVDLYVGGASHAVMHLLYARFWHRVLYDLGLVTEPEPFKRLFNQGMVTAFAFKDSTGRLVPSDEVISKDNGYYRSSAGGEKVERFITKMAKSLRNVINPDDVIAEKGCDAFRLYSMFMGPLDLDKPWATDGITGCEKFLRKFWNYLVAEDDSMKLGAVNEQTDKVWKALHKALKRVNDSFANFNFNTAVAGMMETLNDIQEVNVPLTKEQAEMFVKMMAPFAPHVSAELWQRLGHSELLDYVAWPVLEEKYLKDSDFELVLQVNGKIKKRAQIPVDMAEAEVLALAEKELAEFINGKPILKKIHVKQKLVNFVVKG